MMLSARRGFLRRERGESGGRGMQGVFALFVVGGAGEGVIAGVRGVVIGGVVGGAIAGVVGGLWVGCEGFFEKGREVLLLEEAYASQDALAGKSEVTEVSSGAPFAFVEDGEEEVMGGKVGSA
jgi:hypothetical protein